MKGIKGKPADWTYENFLGRQEGIYIGGTDEVGRGSWGGNLCVCAAVFHPSAEVTLEKLRDSKKYTAADREKLVELFTKNYINKGLLHVAYADIDPVTIENGNLNELNLLGFSRAFQELKKIARFDKIIIDGDIKCGDDDFPWLDDSPGCLGTRVMTLVKADEQSITVATASIFAKVRHDRQMIELDKLYPAYGFASHVGYGTEAHREAILKHGPIPGVHRSNFLRNLRKERVLQ
jgi:ribonuclease HII